MDKRKEPSDSSGGERSDKKQRSLFDFFSSASSAPRSSKASSVPVVDRAVEQGDVEQATQESVAGMSSMSTKVVDTKVCPPGCPEKADLQDIGRLVGVRSQLTDSDRVSGLQERWVPSRREEFPACQHMIEKVLRPTSCNTKHLDQFKWLAISQYGTQTGAWCSSWGIP